MKNFSKLESTLKIVEFNLFFRPIRVSDYGGVYLGAGETGFVVTIKVAVLAGFA